MPPVKSTSVKRLRKHHPRSAIDVLNAIDWDFTSRQTGSELESVHPYPAKFIPDIPGSFLDALELPAGSIVFDPFAGSGTTLVESQRRGLKSIGVDLNPIGCLIARVKTSAIPNNTEAALSAVLAAARKVTSKVPVIPNLDHWFDPGIQLVVNSLCKAIDRAPEVYRDIFRLGLSSILVRISNQDSDTRYAAVEKNIDPRTVPTIFHTAVTRILRSLAGRHYGLTTATVIQGDTLTIDPALIGRRVGAVITSPPYPNAYEYWLYHKYRMYWLGFDPQAVKEKEIGARAHFFKTNRHTAGHFVDQMRKTFSLIDQILLPEGYAAFVVGRSKIHGEIIDNASIIETVASEFKFKHIFKTERVISSTRKSFNLSHANIKTETVLVLTR